MKRKFIFLSIGMGLIFALPSCSKQKAVSGKVRPPASAGQFYPGSREELRRMIAGFLDSAKKVAIDGEIIGIWVPHAGYVYSGQVAANGYRLVQGKQYDAVVVIGPSHSVYFKGVSINDWDSYQTPLGTVAVEKELVKKFQTSSALISDVEGTDRNEHSVEVQIPFIQTVLPGIPIVPAVAGRLTYPQCREIADAIARTIDQRRVLLVASSDMSHFPNYQDANRADAEVLGAVKRFDPLQVYSLEETANQKQIPALDCALCGANAVTTVMLAAKALGADQVEILPYANSGDVTGDQSRVVGYGAAVFYKHRTKTTQSGGMPLDEIAFSKSEREKLFRIARQNMLAALKREKPPAIPVDEPNLLIKRGVFVTLTNQGRLRGCIGHFGQDFPLHEIVREMAVAAATQDYRFAYNSVTPDEMERIDIKISILSDLKKINSIDEIELGKHGIWVKQGGRSGTYLPEVATETGWSKIEFLEHCCAEKAGLSADAWKKGAELYIYTSQILDEKE